MKIAFFISSAINLDLTTDVNFNYAPRRSAFSSEERFRQTQQTINSINLVMPDCHIYLLDISENYIEYKDRLSYVPNLTFVGLEGIDPDSAQLCRTHKSKGLCEATSTVKFLDHYIEELKEYDYVVKFSGRYFLTQFDKSIFTEENKDNFLIHTLYNWPWKDHWGYPESMKRNNELFWMFTCIYGFGKNRLEEFYQGVQQIPKYYIENPELALILDFENAMYYNVLEDKPFVKFPCRVAGWGGANGDFGQF